MKKIIFIYLVSQLLFSADKNVEPMLDMFDKAFYQLQKSYVDSINTEEVIKSGILNDKDYDKIMNPMSMTKPK